MVAMFVLLHANPVKENVVKRSFDKFTHLGEDAIKSLMELKGDQGFSASEIHNSSPTKETSMTSKADDAFSASDIRNANKMKETLMTSKAVDAFSASDIRKGGASRALLSWWLDATKPPQEMKPYLMERKVHWVANKRFEISKFKFKIPRARTCELHRARSRLYRRQILQVNTRWKALAEIYTMHSFAPLSNRKIFVKNC